MVEPGLSRSPTRTELHAWRTFLTAHARVLRNLEAELLAVHRLSLVSYDVLVQLAEAPERRLRMAELADRVLLSRSGVTRLVDRLERAGLVSRQRVAADGRGVIAELTADGLERLRTAAGTHLTGITRHFTAHFDPAELAHLADLCARLAPARELDAPATELDAPATEFDAPATELDAPATELDAQDPG